MDVRRAKLEDAPAILSLLLAATPNEEQWKYCFPSSACPAADVAHAFQVVLERCLADNDGNMHISLLEIPHGSDKADAPRIVSVAVWEKALVGNTRHQDFGQRSWQDLAQILNNLAPTAHKVDTSRLVAIAEAIAQGRALYLDGYGPQMYLHLLATHPDHRQRGYAKALCNRMIKAATQDNLAVSLFASPRGYIFFSGLGFVDLGPISLPRINAWEDGLGLKAMAFLPDRTTACRTSMMSFFGLN